MFLMPPSIVSSHRFHCVSCYAITVLQSDVIFEAMASWIILLSSLFLLVQKGYCIETFGLAGQHIVPSDISGRLFSLDYIEKKY